MIPDPCPAAPATRPPWMEAVFASTMAYRPKSRPMFPQDRHHDIRDHMHETRAKTLAIWTGRAADRYLSACRMLDIRDDPVADSLTTFTHFDLRTLAVAHDHMAAHWRSEWLPRHLSGALPLPDWLPDLASHHLPGCPANCMAAFRHWLTGTTDDSTPHAPEVIRRLCLVLVQQNTAGGIVAEIDLFDTLRKHYPVPPLAP